MKPTVLPFDPGREYYLEERCWINELSNSEADPGLSIAQACVRPGVTTRWHVVKGTIERYVIQSGAGRVEVGELPPTAVGPGDVVVIPPGSKQRIANTGTSDLVFLAICTPRFQRAAYGDVDEQVTQG